MLKTHEPSSGEPGKPMGKFWNTRTWRLTQTIRTDRMFHSLFTPDGAMLITSGWGPRKFWTAPTLSEIDAKRSRNP